MTWNGPLVSIGLPVFNGDRFLRESIDSLLAQSFSDFELVISDNASTDDTSAICEEYERADSRIRYVRNKTNIGGFRNHNKVFELSTGKYFAWASHDDIRLPKYIESCVEVLERSRETILCYTKTTIIDLVRAREDVAG